MKLKEKTTGLLNFSDYKKRRFRLLYWFFVLILAVAVFTALIPVFWLIVTSFKTVTEINSTNYTFFPAVFNIGKIWDVWQKENFGKYFLNSFIVTLGAMASAVLFNGLTAYVIALVKPRGYKVIYVLIMLSYMIPSITGIIPLFHWLSDLRMADNYLPLMLIWGANAFYFVNFKNYFESIPKSLLEAAKMDGCSDLKIFFKVVLPLSKPIVGVVAIFAMTAAWSDFLLPYLLLNDQDMYTVMVEIYNVQSSLGNGYTYDEFLMLLVISIIPQIIIFLIFQKQITNANATNGIKE
ncbi:MAG: carbohydrate ABC transporter permease [Bacilli bacterium]|jgi:multiple sugar transport system permease protein|nr:carbohydrate ABC transporter permease [Bacilli bacterium]